MCLLRNCIGEVRVASRLRGGSTQPRAKRVGLRDAPFSSLLSLDAHVEPIRQWLDVVFPTKYARILGHRVHGLVQAKRIFAGTLAYCCSHHIGARPYSIQMYPVEQPFWASAKYRGTPVGAFDTQRSCASKEGASTVVASLLLVDPRGVSSVDVISSTERLHVGLLARKQAEAEVGISGSPYSSGLCSELTLPPPAIFITRMAYTEKSARLTELVVVPCQLVISPHMPMFLNYDVLAIIMSFCERGDTGSMMRSCRTLYGVGVPYLLYGTVKILSRARFISLCRFILHEPSHRSRYLRDLDLRFSGNFKTPDADRLVAGLFEHATSLEILRLAYQSFVPLGERVFRAISTLNSVRTLALRDACDQSYTLLEWMRSPLSSVEMNFYNDWADDPADPVLILARFKDTLQEMHVTWAQFSTSSTSYLNLTTLYVDDCRFAEIEFIYHSFPNLRHLSLWMGQEDDGLDGDEIEAHRNLNLEAQERGRWESLQTLNSSLLSLYMLGLRSRVINLSLDSGYFETDDTDRLSVMLSDSRPSSLELRLRVPEFDPTQLGYSLAPVRDTLTSLLLNLEIHKENYAQCNAIINRTLSSLSALNIRLLHIRIDESPDSIDSDVVNVAFAEGVTDTGPSSTSLSQLDLGPLAQSIVRSIPSLQHLCLEVAELRTHMWDLRSELETAGG
ncbi:hypothetical protein PHLGIDRAFT_12078 [Phlebiopsis gigantea 11061_1 CR5-6]|uniref:Uncharacterized protein n=1 Tax=Phlebiopsis gigantea (strain 11061_1 CR5-6) TaxID=745531 RepID=A0A0C3SAL3_PHLG1|nr:hypothetical protein PHLGIDRAFT_12078 [Phlebiopsis gigantea 11061_1 CR5-6]